MSISSDQPYGHILYVDLSGRSMMVRSIPREYISHYIGGRGLGARLLWELLPNGGTNPRSPENPLIFIPGPLSGLPIPSSTRTSVITKSPHLVSNNNGFFKSTISYSNMGGYIGPSIRKAGYEGLVITGRAANLVYLVIDNGEVTIEDGSFLAGKSTNETVQLLSKKLEADFNVCYIGPAGESGSSLATIMTTGASAAGRGGAGGVMGSKNLKAIAIRGTGNPSVVNLNKYYSLVKALPVKDVDPMEDPSESPCRLCNLDCRRGGYSKGDQGNSNSSGGHSISKMLGRILNMDNNELMREMVDMADNWGVDIISSAVIISNYYGGNPGGRDQNEILTSYLDLCRKGAFSSTTNNNKIKIPAIKGHIFAIFRPVDEFRRWALSHATSNRGSCHINGSTPERQDENALVDSIGSCSYARGLFGTEIKYSEYLEAITGITFSEEDLITVGRRVFTLEKMFNIREGFTRDDDTIPSEFFAKTENGETKLVTPDYSALDNILKDYYIKRGWDIVTSIPPVNILNDLQLGFTIP